MKFSIVKPEKKKAIIYIRIRKFHDIARKNLTNECGIESQCGDTNRFQCVTEPLDLYLFSFRRPVDLGVIGRLFPNI